MQINYSKDMTRRVPIEIIADPEQDDPRTLKILAGKARNLRMSENTRIAATAAKWEQAIHQALQSILDEKDKGQEGQK